MSPRPCCGAAAADGAAAGQYCRAGSRTTSPASAGVSVIWHDRRLEASAGSAVISSIARSSASAGGIRSAKAGSTRTWQVAQVQVPPHSATTASMPAATAASIRLRPTRPEISWRLPSWATRVTGMVLIR